jgi:hypothetical protein
MSVPWADIVKPAQRGRKEVEPSLPPAESSGMLHENTRKPETLMSDILVQAHEAIVHSIDEGQAPKTKAFTRELDSSVKTTQVRELILVGLALRMSREEIEKQVLKEVPDAKLNDAQGSLVHYYRRKYREAIDELYAVVATQIGDVYRYTDKLYRLSRFNSLVDAADKVLSPRLQAGLMDDVTFKTGNLYIKLMEKINFEMGNQNIGRLIRFAPKGMEKESQSAETFFKEKFAGQLPPGFMEKLNTAETVGDNGNK